ncbi:MAG: flagellar biosynthesis protein FlhF, partial [Comamonas sp.]
MNIQRFHAPTAREALAKARMTFGDGTLILSNRPVDGGVEVVATAEDSLPPAQPAPRLQPLVESRRGRLQERADDLAASPVRSEQVHAGLARSSVAKDTEKLAMSTLSFQDYVRERMLRRRQEALHGSAAPAPSEPVERV